MVTQVEKDTKKQKFSMVEVIVVLAVVMSLASIVFSSIKSSSDLAKKVTCMSNVSQIRVYTELHRKDHGLLPYSDVWLTDFSYASPYMSGSADLKVFTCPGDEDATPLTDEAQLVTQTSYYYVPAREMFEENLADGVDNGFSLLNFSDLATKNQLVIYDKSPDHHNGTINVAMLFGDDDPSFGSDGEITSLASDDFLELDAANQLNLEEAPELGSLDINPSNSDNNLFTLTDVDGNTFEIREEDAAGMTGKAINITIKVKSTGRTLLVDGVEIELNTNTTYDITATASSDGSDTEDPYYIFELIQDGKGQGQWSITLFEGIGSVTVSDANSGESTTVEKGKKVK